MLILRSLLKTINIVKSANCHFKFCQLMHSILFSTLIISAKKHCQWNSILVWCASVGNQVVEPSICTEYVHTYTSWLLFHIYLSIHYIMMASVCTDQECINPYAMLRGRIMGRAMQSNNARISNLSYWASIVSG